MSESDRTHANIACTCTFEANLPRALVLAGSYLHAHPDHEFVIAVLDKLRGDPQWMPSPRSGVSVRLLGPDEFGVDTDEYLRLASGYRKHELPAAVKPLLLRSLRERARTVTYLDPTMYVLNELDELRSLAETHGIVLTPYFTRGLPAEFEELDEAALVGHGMLSPALVGAGPGGDAALQAWCTAALRFELTDPGRQLHPEQAWLDRYLTSFEHHVWRDESVHTACWNAFQRKEVPPRLVNLPGYEPASPYLLSTYCAEQPATLLSEHPLLRGPVAGYRRELVAAGHHEDAARTPSWLDELPDGTPFDPVLRNLFRVTWQRYTRAVERERNWPDSAPPPHAYADGGRPFREWLAEPVNHGQRLAGLTRWAMLLHESRTDLQLAFDEPYGGSAEAFRTWCWETAVPAGLLARWAAPSEPPRPRDPDTAFGANLFGHLTAELGVGELGRTLHAAMVRAQVPMVSVVEDRLIANRAELTRPEDTGEPRFGVSVLAVNADLTRTVIERYPQISYRRWRIGVWSWELEEFPESMHQAFDYVDEIWTISEFCRQAIAKHTDKPVHVFPIPTQVSTQDAQAARSGTRTRFLFAFDYNSIAERKNPWGVIDAFQRAFAPDAPTELIIKTINSDRNIAAAERLRERAREDSRITLLERYLSPAELAELYAGADCYVSLHRSEGFGFTVAEAIARGLPVICTDYSGTSEFVHPDSAWLIPYTMTEVGPGCAPYPPDARWAEPDLDAAADAMRAVAADPVSAAAYGRAGQEQLRRARPLNAAAEWVQQRLESAHEAWLERDRALAEAADAADDAFDPPGTDVTATAMQRLTEAREALRWRAESTAPSRIPGAPVLRKAVLRAIDHYDAHNRRMLGALLDGVEGAFTQLVGQVTELQVRLDERSHNAGSGPDSGNDVPPATRS